MWRHNYVIGRNEYRISTLSESTLSCVYSLQFVFKSTHQSFMEIWKKMWLGVFFWTQCTYTTLLIYQRRGTNARPTLYYILQICTRIKKSFVISIYRMYKIASVVPMAQKSFARWVDSTHKTLLSHVFLRNILRPLCRGRFIVVLYTSVSFCHKRRHQLMSNFRPRISWLVTRLVLPF